MLFLIPCKLKILNLKKKRKIVSTRTKRGGSCCRARKEAKERKGRRRRRRRKMKTIFPAVSHRYKANGIFTMEDEEELAQLSSDEDSTSSDETNYNDWIDPCWVPDENVRLFPAPKTRKGFLLPPRIKVKTPSLPSPSFS